MEELSDIEIKAEVFKVIRANTEKSSKSIIKEIKKHLPDVSQEKIQQAIVELIK